MTSELHTHRKSVIFLFTLLAFFLAFSYMASAAGNSGTFQINGLPNAPTNPLCEQEINPSKIYTTTPQFNWTFNENDVGQPGDGTQGGFNIIVGTSEGDSSLWNYTTTSSVQGVVYAGSALSRGVTYHWKVRTNDTYEATMGDFCIDRTFAINNLPTAALVAPSNASTGQILTPLLDWSFSDADGGDSQNGWALLLDSDINFGSPDLNLNLSGGVEEKVNTFCQVTTALTNNTKYYWKIKVKDANEWSDWQGLWEFTTTNITVWDLTTYDVSYTKTSIFSPNQTVVIRYNVTNIENMNNTYITITDPFGIKQVDHQGVSSLQDNFTTSANWVPDTENQWNIVSQTYQHGANGGSSLYNKYSLINTSKLANQTNVTIQVDIDVAYSAEDMQRIIFRWTDANNYCAAYMSTVYSVIGIEERIGGVRYREETSRLYSQNTWYTLKVAVQGTSATVYSNGIPYVTKTLSTNTAGRVGLGTDTGWVYFDNYSIGYANSRVVGPIAGGYQYEFNYTIPVNESQVGTWNITAYAESGGQVSSTTGTFDVISTAPLIKNLTTYNETYVPKTTFVNGANVTIRAWVSDQYGIAGLTKCNITIKDPTGSIKVSGINMTDVGDITNGNIYEYNYTIPHSYDSNGLWNITVTALNNRSNATTKYGSFHDDVGSPNITSIDTYTPSFAPKTVFALGEKIELQATVTSINGREDIVQCNITIMDQNGIYFVTNETMADISDVTNGNVYNYSYTLPSSTANYGTWSITIRTNSTYYDSNKSSNFVLVWADPNYYHRQAITLQEKFAVAHTNEPLGFKITLPSNVCGGPSTLKIVNEKGQVMPFAVQKKVGTDYWIDFVANVTASNTINYYIYYNTTGTAPTQYDSYNSTANENLTVIQANYTQIYYPLTSNMTYGKSVAIADLNSDGIKEIVLVGRNGPSGDNHGFLSIYNYTYTSPTNYVLNRMAYSEWNNNGANEAFCYGLNITDIDNDGVKEMITGGTVYDGIRNKAQLIIWNFTGGILNQEANSTWYDANYPGGDNQTAIYNLIVNDSDGDGVQEILCAGTNGNNEGRGQFSVHNYTGGVIGHEFYYNYSLRAGNNNNNWTEFYALAEGNLYSANSVNQIVVVGDTMDASHKIEGALMVFRYSGGSWLHGTMGTDPDWALNYIQQQLTEFFSVSIGDANNNGNDEVVVSGNQFDGVRDIAQFRVYNFTGPSYPSGIVNDIGSMQWYTYGYSSALTVKIADIDNNTLNEITTVGFQNDGTVDRGDYRIRQWNSSNTLTLHSEMWAYEFARRSGDFGDAAKIEDLNNDGFNELIDTGRYALTPPTGTYIRIQTIGGIKQTFGAEDLLPPNPPTDASVIGQEETNITISWTKGSDANNTHIRYSNSTYPTNISQGTLGYNATGSSYTFEGLEEGTTYYFSLWSWKNGSSSYSDYYAQAAGKTKPKAPTIDAKNPTSSSIQIDITMGKGATHTRIQRGDSGYPTSISDGTNVYNGTGTTTTDSDGLVHTHTYYYRAWSYDSTNDKWSTNYGQDTEITSNIAPTVITNATTSIEEETATLVGQLTDDGGAATCNVGFYYDTTTGGTSHNETVAGSYTEGQEFVKAIASLTKGELYYVSAWAYNTDGFAKAGNEILFLTKPIAPTNLNGFSGGNTIDLNWNEANCGLGETVGTRIQYQIGSAPGTVNEGSTGYNGTSESTQVGSLAPDSHYYFSAWAWVQSGAGGLFQWSDTYETFDIWTTASPPYDVFVNQTTGYSLNISWSKGSGDYTIVVRNETGNENYPTSLTNGTEIYNGTGTTKLDTGLVSGVTYFYSLWSYNSTLDEYSADYATGYQMVAILSLDISVAPGLIDFGTVSIPGSNWTTGMHFNVTNSGADANIKLSVGNTGNWTFVNLSQRGHNKFCVNWSDTNWTTEGNIEPGGSTVKFNLYSLQNWFFDLKVLTPTSISTQKDKEEFILTITATPS